MDAILYNLFVIFGSAGRKEGMKLVIPLASVVSLFVLLIMDTIQRVTLSACVGRLSLNCRASAMIIFFTPIFERTATGDRNNQSFPRISLRS